MKLAISYFYQIRNFKPWMIPVSTAVYDPKWFHNGKDIGYVYVDKNGVYNGFRTYYFQPGPECSEYCRGRDVCNDSPSDCAFLRKYREQISKVNCDEFIKKCEILAEYVKERKNLEEDPIVVLMVYEKPNNPCSERHAIKEYFKEHGIELAELDTFI